MNLPIELILWILGGLGFLLTLNAHMLVRILSKVSAICTTAAVEDAKTAAGFLSQERRISRNEADIQTISRHVPSFNSSRSRIPE